MAVVVVKAKKLSKIEWLSITYKFFINNIDINIISYFKFLFIFIFIIKKYIS